MGCATPSNGQVHGQRRLFIADRGPSFSRWMKPLSAIVGYFDLPSVEPKLIGDETIDRYRRAFWCGAAGVRMDLLGREYAVQVFQRLLYEAFLDARSLGYEFVRAAAPWEQHPNLPTPFATYPGLTIERLEDERGESRFLIEWRLADAIGALANETV